MILPYTLSKLLKGHLRKVQLIVSGNLVQQHSWEHLFRWLLSIWMSEAI